MESDSTTFKLVLLGEGCVGKTSLLLRYAENKFNDKHVTTLQATYLTKRVNIEGSRVTLNMWDTAGQERFHALGPIYYRGSDGAMLVYDVTDEQSFDKVKVWVTELRRICGSEVLLCIVGNKVDLERDRRVSQESAEAFAESVGASHCQTSAKTNAGIVEAFAGMAKRMYDKWLASERSQANSRNRRQQRGILIGDESDEQLDRRQCSC